MSFIGRETIPLAPADAGVRAHYENVLLEGVKIVWRRRWLVFAILAATLTVVAAALLAVPKQYRSEALIHVDVAHGDGSVPEQGATGVALEAAAVLETEARIIRSREVARRVVATLHLVDHPDFAMSQPSTLRVWWSGIAAWLFLQRPDGDAIVATRPVGDPDVSRRADLVALSLLRGLAVQSDNRSYLISVAYTAGNPSLAASIANAFAEAYRQHRREASLAAADGMGTWYTQQLTEARAHLGAVEGELQAQRARTGLSEAGAGGTAALQQRLRNAIDRHAAAHGARQTAEARLRRIEAAVRAGTRPAAVDLAGSAGLQQLLEAESQAIRELADLSSRLGERHPQIRRAEDVLEALRSTIAKGMDDAVVEMRAQLVTAVEMESARESDVARLEQARIAAKGGEDGLRTLQMSVERARDRVRMLTDRREQTLAVRDLQPLNSRIAVRAEPVPWPSAPKPALFLGLGAVGALGLGVLLSLLLERRDVGFRTASEVASATGVPCLGMLPALPERGTGSDVATAIFLEAVGSIGAMIGPGPDRRCRVILVTSALPREDKSLVLSGLAHALTGRGLRVLMIDGAPASLAGSSSSSVPLQEIYSSGDSGRAFFGNRADDRLCVIDRTGAPRHAPNGYTCAAFESMIEEARRRFDVVLIEGPPVMLLADSLVLSRGADIVLCVARWRRTPRKTVTAAIDRLATVTNRLGGVVIAGVDMVAHRKYSFFDQAYFYLRHRRFYAGRL